MSAHEHDCHSDCSPRTDGAQVLADHIAECRPDIEATIVMHQGSADDVVAQMLAAGWTWGAATEYVAGKRIRTLVAPQAVSDTGTDEAAVWCPACMRATAVRDGDDKVRCCSCGYAGAVLQ